MSFENLKALQKTLSGKGIYGKKVNIGINIKPKKKSDDSSSAVAVDLSVYIKQAESGRAMLVGNVSSKNNAGKVEGLDKAQASFTYMLPETQDVQNILQQGDPVVALADLTEKDPSVRGMMEDIVTRAIHFAGPQISPLNTNHKTEAV